MNVRTQRHGIVVVALVALMGAGGCASTQGRLVLTEDSVHDALARVDDQVRIFCTSTENAERYKAPCADVRKVLIPTLESGAAFNRAVADQKLSGLMPMLESIGNLVTELKKLPTGATGSMIAELAKAIAAAYQEVNPATPGAK